MSGVYRNDAARDWRAPRAASALAFHRALPGYRPTRLVRLPELARELGVREVFVKEEAGRWGLPAFKILGASYALSRALSERVGSDDALLPDELRARLAAQDCDVEVIAATDGNHGRAVARVARMLGLRARVFTPHGISAAAEHAIEAEGAQRVGLPLGYDDVVRAAADAAAADPRALLVQDTSWDGYERIPRWIVEGYATLVEEADAQLAAAGAGTADVVAVPVGVGSLAQAVVGHYRSAAPSPTVLSVEPDAAPALHASLEAGRALSVETGETVMAGLNCGTPTGIGWDALRLGIDRAVRVGDGDASRAVRDLERLGVDAGPCGAATLAGVRRLAQDERLAADAVVLLLSTESRSANPLPGG